MAAKFAEGPYRVGERSLSWLKVKCKQRQEFVITGWRVPDFGEGIASLLLGTYEKGELVYRGRVGTGFSEKTLIDLRRRLQPLRRETSPLAKVPRGLNKVARWVEPALVAEVEYSELTPDGSLRHPSYKGLREDKKPKEVTLEKPIWLGGENG